MTTALIIIYNHRYDRNIDALENIYNGRFTHIYHVMPFYDGNKVNVIPVYGNSYFYSIYIAQAFKFFFKEHYSSYCFIADDIALNPLVNETNLHAYLGVTENECFIPEIKSLHEISDRWHTHTAVHYKPHRWGVEASNEIPSYEEAISAFKRHNLELKPLARSQVFAPEMLSQTLRRQTRILFGREQTRKELYTLNYPLVAAFSDFLLVSNDAISKFAHYCGAFAALELFVELAIPTALVFSARTIKAEAELKHKGRYLWTKEELNTLDIYQRDLPNLFHNFPADCLFIHPIKLSQWKLV